MICPTDQSVKVVALKRCCNGYSGRFFSPKSHNLALALMNIHWPEATSLLTFSESSPGADTHVVRFTLWLSHIHMIFPVTVMHTHMHTLHLQMSTFPWLPFQIVCCHMSTSGCEWTCVSTCARAWCAHAVLACVLMQWGDSRWLRQQEGDRIITDSGAAESRSFE